MLIVASQHIGAFIMYVANNMKPAFIGYQNDLITKQSPT